MPVNEGKFEVKFIDRGYSAKEKPDPKYPEGMDADLSHGADLACKTALPYPAPRCGYYAVVCKICQTNAMITVAGRPDDPRSLTLPCKSLVRV